MFASSVNLSLSAERVRTVTVSFAVVFTVTTTGLTAIFEGESMATYLVKTADGKDQKLKSSGALCVYLRRNFPDMKRGSWHQDNNGRLCQILKTENEADDTVKVIKID